MVQKKEEAPVPAAHVVPEPDKTWEEMNTSEKVDYINSLLVDPHDIIPSKFDLMTLLCNYIVEHPANEGISYGEKVMATSLAKMGWKLQQPVRVIKYEEFRI